MRLRQIQSFSPRFSNDLGRHPVLGLLTAGLLLLGFVTLARAAPIDVGYRDFSYPGSTGSNGEPSGEKPESKLWFADGIWWGSLWNTAAGAYRIHRFVSSTQSWTPTSTTLDDRSASRADTLFHAPTNKLYVASHLFSTTGQSASPGSRGELFRYSYNPAADTYTLDSGFPVEINQGRGETLVIARDSTGTLWAAWVEAQQVMVNHSVGGNDASWGTPFQLPGSAATTTDDIASIVAYEGGIGVLWSDQGTTDFYFARHVDGAADTSWTRATIFTTSSDDHINLQPVFGNPNARLLAAVKTGQSSILIMLLRCKTTATFCTAASDWDSFVVYNSSTYTPTRPIVQYDKDANRVHVISALQVQQGDGTELSPIAKKSTSLSAISFDPSSAGEIFIRELDVTININDPSAEKANIDSQTGLLAIASASSNDTYYHNFIGGTPPPAVTITSFTPTSGTPGTEVTINGTGFTGASAVTFGTTPAASFVVDSATRIRAIVPSASAGAVRISVTAPGGTATASSDFTILASGPAVTITSFTPTSGTPGTEVTINGTGFTGASAVAFGTTPAASFVVDSSTRIRAIVPNASAGAVRISVTAPGGSATASSDFTIVVNPPPVSITGFTPTSGTPGTEVAIDGMGFSGASAVTFGATPAGSFVVDSATRIRAIVPNASPGAVRISVTAPGGTATASSDFTISTGGGSGLVRFEEVASGSGAITTSVSTATSLNAVAGDLYLAAIGLRSSSVTGVSGLGLVWTEVDSQCSGRNAQKLSVWKALGTPSGSGPVTATFAASTNGAAIVVARYSGVDPAQPIGNGVSGNTLGENGACTGGVDGASYSFPLVMSAPGNFAYGAVSMRNRTNTPGTGFIERAELAGGSSGDVASAAAQDRAVSAPGTVSVDGTLSGLVDWAMIGLELRAQQTGTGCTTNGECDDGLFCNGAESCVGGSCTAGTAPNCADSVSCTTDSCVEATDSCSHTPSNAACSDGQFCNGSETCNAVAGCQAGTAPNCADSVSCTTDSCNESTDSCSHVPNNAVCSDGLFCNGAETCNVTLGCQAGTAAGCDDGFSCTADSCDEGTDSCSHVPNNALCNDGLFCNGSETCDAALGCRAGTAPNCADSVSCTTDSCVESSDSCSHTPSNTACSDGQFCNGSETCDAVAGCQAGIAPNCVDSVSCTTDSCNEATDSCSHVPDNTVCSDGLFCNGAETCNATLGCQAGTAAGCDDGFACTADSCDEAADSCSHVPNNALCSDGLFCNGSETCDAALGCRAASKPPCRKGHKCTVCDESLDVCTSTRVSCP